MASSWKGKRREDAQGGDPAELDPVITYRHLLSSGLGVRNPLRVCGLTDMDAFYAACEQKRLGVDPSLPLVVRQWDALIAVNYPARTFGISRMDKISAALQRCPHLQVVHVATFNPSIPDAKPTYTNNPNSETHKVSLDYYRKESRKIMEVFKEMLPGAEVERASIDEAFIDFTELVRQQILAYFPHLATPPPEGLDSSLPPPPCGGIPLAYPPSRSASQGVKRNIWADLGILVPISGKPPDPPISKGDTSPNESSRSPQTSSDFIPREGDEERSNAIASSGHSWFAEIEDVEINEDHHHLSEDEDYDPPVDTLTYDSASGPSLEDRPPTWHDVGLSIAASLMLRMRDEVKTRLGYTTSAGIARNKFLAKYLVPLEPKLVASYKKRDSQTILRNAAIPNYLRPLPFQKIRFLGGKLGTALAATFEAQTVGDLLDISIEEMQRKFGENSIWVWEILRGIDRSEVKEKPSVTKSMGASKNLQHPISHPSEGAHWLRILAGELAFRLQEARGETPGLWPKTLVLHIRQSYETTRSKQAVFPFTRSLNIDHIFKAANKLWVELVGTGAEYDKNMAMGRATGMKITNVFLGFSGVEAMAAGQQSIEGFFSGNSGPKKRRAPSQVDYDGIKKRRTDGARPLDGDPDSPKDGISSTAVSFHCSLCCNKVRRNIDDEVDREVALSILKMEHDDFHFAQNLAKESGGSADQFSEIDTQTKKKDKKARGESKGIAKFFTPVASKR